ncbi:MAG: nucleoside kinase [Candidatus Hydrogenedentota bacterium]
MNNKISLKILRRKPIKLEPNKTVKEIFAYTRFKTDLPIFAAKVNNRLVSLDYVVKFDSYIEPLTYNSKEGASIYRRSLTHILVQAIIELYPDVRPVVGQSILNGYYYDLKNGPKMTNKILKNITSKMKSIIKEDRVFKFSRFPVEYACKFFEEKNYIDKSRLLKYYPRERVDVCICGEFVDIANGPYVPSTKYITAFELYKYPPGFVLRFPKSKDPFNLAKIKGKERKLFNIYKETREWNEILGLENISDLNKIINEGDILEEIMIAEGLHEKKIVKIADEITKRKNIRLIVIAGPSASGKTTFAKRLIIQLKVNGLRPVQISVDDYFVDREKTPRDEKGDYDFESLGAVDVKLLNEHLLKLFEGSSVSLPEFNFKKGKQMLDVKPPLKIDSDQIIILEGIHGLNEALTPHIPKNIKYKIYVSSLTQLCLDYNNRIFTSDTRLLRRIVRDAQFRGYTATSTLSRWQSVRRGEAKNIFPFQEESNVMFNSALIYEQCVLKLYAQPQLNRVRPADPNYAEARRLYDFLDYFLPVFPDDVPQTSILREFIGGSKFEY